MTERLDRVERVLEALASNLEAERQARLVEREDIHVLYDIAQQTGERLDQVAERLEGLTIRVDGLADRVNGLTQLMERSIESANADRAIIRESQIEVRRIWEYLLRQSPNGHGE